MWCLKCCKEIKKDDFDIIVKYELCKVKHFHDLLSAICYLKKTDIKSNIFVAYIEKSNKHYIFINSDINDFNKNITIFENIIINARILDNKIKQDLVK